MIDKVKSLQWFPFDKKAADKPAPNIEPYNKAKVNMAINLPLTLEGVISANIVAASGAKNPTKKAAKVLLIIRVYVLNEMDDNN